jgi:hypothetical protein
MGSENASKNGFQMAKHLTCVRMLLEGVKIDFERRKKWCKDYTTAFRTLPTGGVAGIC